MKKRTSKPNKSDFVRSQGKKPAKEVVALAAKRGMKLTERYVYVIRSADKAKAKRRTTVRAGKTVKDNPEARLRRAIAELGLARTRAVLADIEKVLG